MTESKQSIRMRRLIRETFMRLSEDRPVSKIGVVDIIEAADISRSTFYRYYADIYELYADCLMGNGGRNRNEPNRSEDDFFNMLYDNILRGFVGAEQHESLYPLKPAVGDAVMMNYLEGNREETREHIRLVAEQMGLHRERCLFDYDYAIDLLLLHFDCAVNHWMSAGRPVPAYQAASQSMVLFFRLVDVLKQGCPVLERYD